MSDSDGIVRAAILDGDGGGRAVGWPDIEGWGPGHGPLWVHLDRSVERARRWLEETSGLDPTVVEALLAEETRPRCVSIAGGLLVILRGVNLNPGHNPEDMVSIRIWADDKRLISVRRRRILAVEDVGLALEAGNGPRGTAECLVRLADRLVDRMSPALTDLEDDLDDIESRGIVGATADLRSSLATYRRTLIALRRYLAPQRDALSRLYGEPAAWLSDADRMQLREIHDRVMRYVEDLDAARERAAIVQDETANRLAERMNRNTYVLSIVAAVFLPLGFVTGLLGINVAGIPGAETPWAFAAVAGGLAVVAVAEYWLLRRLGWF